MIALVVGSVNASLLGSVQHLRDYFPEDIFLLQDLLQRFHSTYLTPHVATEASHFIGKIAEKHGRIIRARFVEVINSLGERYPESRVAAARVEYAWLDLADCTLLETAPPDDVLLSTDAKLVARRLDLGFPAVNLNHLREQAGLL